jgi:phage baseplate assembly protein W
MVTRSDRFTINTKSRERYSDFARNFDLNPVTGFLAKITNENAVEQSMYNLIMTGKGEVPFESSLGSTIRSSLFELNDERNRSAIENSIKEAIQLHEPRVDLDSVILTVPDNEPNSVYVSIRYSLVNIADEDFIFEFVVTRVR